MTAKRKKPVPCRKPTQRQDFLALCEEYGRASGTSKEKIIKALKEAEKMEEEDE